MAFTLLYINIIHYNFFPLESGFKPDSKDGVSGDADPVAVFQEECSKARQKIPVINSTDSVLNISMKDFADLVIKDTAPYNYKRFDY